MNTASWLVRLTLTLLVCLGSKMAGRWKEVQWRRMRDSQAHVYLESVYLLWLEWRWQAKPVKQLFGQQHSHSSISSTAASSSSCFFCLPSIFLFLPQLVNSDDKVGEKNHLTSPGDTANQLLRMLRSHQVNLLGTMNCYCDEKFSHWWASQTRMHLFFLGSVNEESAWHKKPYDAGKGNK